MKIESTKLRRLTIGMHLIAGFGLLTASYFTTEKGWANDLLKATVHSEQPADKNVGRTIKVKASC